MAVPRRRLLQDPVSLITCLSLVLVGVAPVVAASSMSVNIVSSPTLVTRGGPVSYVIELQNTGNNSINHTTLEADTPPGFTYRRALTTKGTCNAAPASDPVCDLGQFSAGTPALVVLIFDTSPSAPLGTFDFVVTVRGGGGETTSRIPLARTPLPIRRQPSCCRLTRTSRRITSPPRAMTSRPAKYLVRPPCRRRTHRPRRPQFRTPHSASLRPSGRSAGQTTIALRRIRTSASARRAPFRWAAGSCSRHI